MSAETGMDASTLQERTVEQVSSVPPIVATKAVARSVGPGGGHITAPAARSGLRALWETAKGSPWFSVATRSIAIVAGMLGLAGIGVASTLSGVGVPLAIPKAGPAPSVSGVWIAPDGPSAGGGPPPGSASAGVTPPVTTPVDDSGAHSAESSSAPKSGSGITPDGKIILNVASADELTKLPRVGAKRARAILELRKKLGRFRRPTDLLRVRGIGRKTLKLMLPMLVLDPPG